MNLSVCRASRLLCPSLLLILSLSLTSCQAPLPPRSIRVPVQAPSRLDLAGTVLGPDGRPLAGATVAISCAYERDDVSVGLGPDIGRHVATDGDGRFRIASVDPGRIFDVRAVKEGYRPQLTRMFDPTNGPTTFRMRPASLKPRDARYVLRGRVVDAAQRPVAGAFVRPVGYTSTWKGVITWCGAMCWEPYAVTNAAGEFHLECRKPAVSLQVAVESPGMADCGTDMLPVGLPSPAALRMDPGATLSGTVVDPYGNGIVGAVVTVSVRGALRARHVEPRRTRTTAGGAFVLDRVPARRMMALGVSMEGLSSAGLYVPAQEITTPAAGEAQKDIRLVAAPGATLRCRLHPPPGTPLPSPARVSVWREADGNCLRAVAGKDGTAVLRGMPVGETLSVMPVVAGLSLPAPASGHPRFAPPLRVTIPEGAVEQTVEIPLAPRPDLASLLGRPARVTPPPLAK